MRFKVDENLPIEVADLSDRKESGKGRLNSIIETIQVDPSVNRTITILERK